MRSSTPAHRLSSSNPPDITFFLDDLNGGGAERITVHLAEGISDLGYRVDLLLVNALGPYLEQVSNQVRIVSLGTGRTSRSLIALRRYIATSRTPVIISALHHVNLAALLTKRIYRLPTRIIATLHNTFSAERRHDKTLKGKIKYALIASCYRWADEIVAVSEGAAIDFATATGISRKSITTIYNPVITNTLFEQSREPLEHPWLVPGQPPLVLAIGRLDKQKDFPTLIRAFRILRESTPARLLILGEGTERSNLEKMIKEYKLQDCVALPGFVSNPYAYLRQAKAFALSSLWEGLPTVLIEALALNVPIVSTDCPSGPREILADGRYGKLVPVGDDRALARALADTLNNQGNTVPESVWKAYTKEVAAANYLRLARVNSHA